MGKLNDYLDDDKIYELAATGTALLASVLVKRLLETGWKKVKHEDPPKNPADSDVTWTDAITWTLATGVMLSLAKVLARRGAAAGYNKLKKKK